MAEPTRRRLRAAVGGFGAIGGCAAFGALVAMRRPAAVSGFVVLYSLAV
jgi:hypothetical protein